MLELLLVLLLTIAIELVVVWLFGYRDKLFLLSLVLINVITNLSLNYLLLLNNVFFLINNLLLIIVLEAFVIVIEGLMLAYFTYQEKGRMLLLSLVMNLASAFIGFYLLFRVVEQNSLL
jgi:hypothetical protein